MLQENSIYGDVLTDNTEADDSPPTPYAEESESDGDKTPTTEESRAATEQTTDDITPLPTIGCSTSHDPHQTQRIPDQDSTPIPATVTVEKENEKDQEKVKVS